MAGWVVHMGSWVMGHGSWVLGASEVAGRQAGRQAWLPRWWVVEIPEMAPAVENDSVTARQMTGNLGAGVLCSVDTWKLKYVR